MLLLVLIFFFFFSSRRRHTRCYRDWSSDVCSSDLVKPRQLAARRLELHRSSVCREITHVGPVEYLNRAARAHKACGCKSSPKTLQTNVCSGHPPIASSFDQLHVVYADYAFTV